MNKYLLFLLVLIYSFDTNAQPDNPLILGQIDSIDSKILAEKRGIWIYVPDEIAGSIYAKKSYPVVYLLDGDAHFYSVVGMIHQLSSINGNTICPKMIVVGIPNTNRTRDLTPSKGNPNHPFSDSTLVANSGGGENFISFIEKELIPHIDANYPTEPYRMLIGHSFGGLTVMNTLMHHPELFNSYVAIDPSMWWADQKLLKEIKQASFDDRFENKALFLAIANTVGEGTDTSLVQMDTTFNTEHLRKILALNKDLSSRSSSPLNYRTVYYSQEDHGSVPLMAEYDALHFLFDFYHLKIGMQDILDTTTDLYQKVVEHYVNLSQVMGYAIKPSEELVNALGYQFLGLGQLKKAEKYFLLNTSNYPESFNAYDSLGDCYVGAKNKQKAIEAFKKSIALNKDSYSKPKLEELLKE